MIKETIQSLKEELPATVKLVAVSKFHPLESIIEAYDAGQRVFAESRPQELSAKVELLQQIRASKADESYMSDISWHFIGHLQTNKLKMVLSFVDLVESVDSFRLLQAIDKWGSLNDKVTDILLECHISSDSSKQGFTSEEICEVLNQCSQYKYVRIRGVMGMATLTDDESVIKSDFARLVDISRSVVSRLEGASEISMGMSGDYEIAVKMGSTMVRIGSMIFGPRQY